MAIMSSTSVSVKLRKISGSHKSYLVLIMNFVKIVKNPNNHLDEYEVIGITDRIACVIVNTFLRIIIQPQ